ncbi:50S ribosomal protein L25/general stress protein Ctc [Catalinimonas sp. 4WD22]|uniref:50S ribosomal protein L25/general stress protein Ctc n=1 Tax=Catalinimonas locisalis TaxID=3133978 RepID=UPI003100DF94
MKTVEIIGYKRANLGKKEAKRLRAEGNVPCVVYGSGEQIHFYAPMILFRPLVYTPEAHMVDLNIEGEHKRCILQDIQFHPVNEVILHADFLELQEKKPVKMEIPLHLIGNAPGVGKGGTLMFKRRSLRLKALPKNMPEHINVDVSGLDFGKSIKVKDVKAEDFEILDNPAVSIAVIEVPRALRGRTEDAEEEGVEEEGVGVEEEETQTSEE